MKFYDSMIKNIKIEQKFMFFIISNEIRSAERPRYDKEGEKMTEWARSKSMGQTLPAIVAFRGFWWARSLGYNQTMPVMRRLSHLDFSIRRKRKGWRV